MTRTEAERRAEEQRLSLLALRDALNASGLSTEDYAKHILLREGRTVRRWLKAESPIPHVVCQWLLDGKWKYTTEGR